VPVRVWLRATASTHYERAPRFSNPRRNALLKEGSKSDKADTHKLADLLHENAANWWPAAVLPLPDSSPSGKAHPSQKRDVCAIRGNPVR
jgi:hypothetical protein